MQGRTQISLPGTVSSFIADGVRYRADFRRCKPPCRGCPHGPYWGALCRGADGFTERRYIGATRFLPAAAQRTLAQLEGREPS